MRNRRIKLGQVWCTVTFDGGKLQSGLTEGGEYQTEEGYTIKGGKYPSFAVKHYASIHQRLKEKKRKNNNHHINETIDRLMNMVEYKLHNLHFRYPENRMEFARLMECYQLKKSQEGNNIK